MNPTGDSEVLYPTELASSISILYQCRRRIYSGRVSICSNALTNGPGVQPAGNGRQDNSRNTTTGLAIVVDLCISRSVRLEDRHVVPAGTARVLDRRVGINKRWINRVGRSS